MKLNIRWLIAAIGIVVLAVVGYGYWQSVNSLHFTSDPAEIAAIQQKMGVSNLPVGFTAAHALAPGNGEYTLMLEPINPPLNVELTVSSFPGAARDESVEHPLTDCTETQTLEVGGSNPPIEMHRADCLPKDKPSYQMVRAHVQRNSVAYSILATGVIHPATVIAAVQLVRIIENQKVSLNAPASVPDDSTLLSGHQILVRGVKTLSCDNEHMHSPKHTLATSLDITNLSDGNLAVDWLNYHGKPQRMATVFIGATWHADTNESNGWRLSMNGKCAAVILTSSIPGAVEFH